MTRGSARLALQPGSLSPQRKRRQFLTSHLSREVAFRASCLIQTEGLFMTIAKLGLLLVCLMSLTLETKEAKVTPLLSSVGGALALAAWTCFTCAAQQLKSEGSFAGFANLVSYADIKGLFVADNRMRQSDGRRSQRVTYD